MIEYTGNPGKRMVMKKLTKLDKLMVKVFKARERAYKAGYVAGVNDTLLAMGRKHGIMGIVSKARQKIDGGASRPLKKAIKGIKVSEKDI